MVVRRYTKVTTNRYILIALCVVIITAVIGAGIARADTTPLANVEPGSTIRFSGLEWIVLEHKSDGKTYIILKTPTVQRAFDPDRTNRFDPTDSNNIGYYLNTTFYNSLSQKELIETVTWQQEDYPGVSAKIGLLTLSEYTQYSTVYQGSVLPNIPYRWWLLSTPTSTTEFVCTVDGTLYGYWSNANADATDIYCRPALYLQAGLMVDSSGTVQEGPVQPPTGLTANPTATSVTLNWNPSPGVDGYKIYRNGTLVATVSGSQTSYTDNGLTPNNTYTYAVSAYKGAQESSVTSITVTTLMRYVRDQEVGTIIRFSGTDWVVVGHDESGNTMIIQTEPETSMVFDYDRLANNRFNPSDTNNVAYWLNTTFYNAIEGKELVQDRQWSRVQMMVDGSDGTDYGAVTAKVGLLDAREYLTIKDLLPASMMPSGYTAHWWLRTPGPDNLTNITVGDNGNLTYDYVDALHYVYPVIVLKKDVVLDDSGNVVGIGIAAPTNITHSQPSDTSVRLSWDPSQSEDVEGYIVYRDNQYLADVGDATEYTDTGLAPGQTYTYQIAPYNSSGEGIRSGPYSVTVRRKPTNLTYTRDRYQRYTLSWQPSADENVAGYKVYRNGEVIADVGNATEYTDCTLSPGSTYTYQVASYYTTGEQGPLSDPVTVEVPIPVTAPSGLTNTNSAPGNVTLSWNASTDPNVAGYHVYRDNELLADVGNATQYTDTTAEPGKTYTYEVVPYDRSGIEGQCSDPITVQVPDVADTLTAWWKGNYIEVKWRAENVTLGSRAVLWRQMENGPWQAIKVLKPEELNGFTYKDYNVAIGLNCRYQIRQQGTISNWFAWSTAAESGWATGDRPFAAPKNVRIAYGEDTAVVSWDTEDGQAPYAVKYSTDGGETWRTTYTSSGTITVPRRSKVRIKAQGSYSHWTGLVTVR
ncbi:MAG TPA: hypothetical protein GXX39_02395 [Syntrophothermus lipocalidus]|nr:hypothetical protein [Syntrophothermus lipocalidus]